MYRPENMDVYLNKEVDILPEEKAVPETLHNVILLVPAKEAAAIANKKEQLITGENAIIVL